MPTESPDDQHVPCSCLLCKTEVLVPLDGRWDLFDVLGLGSGYKFLTHDCTNPDVEAMWRDIDLIPNLIQKTTRKRGPRP
jgi:hypothetical protein